MYKRQVTDWFRELAPKPKARATAFLNAVELSTSQKLAALHMPIRLRWEVTSGYAEAQYEWKAIEYAVRPATVARLGREAATVGGEAATVGTCRCSLDHPRLQVRQWGLPQPLLCLSGGRGSVQVTGLEASSSVSAPLSDGAT